MKRGETVELKIEKMAIGGFGIARLDGFVIFVKGGVCGDVVRARIYKKKKDYAEAKVVEVLEPSSERTQPLCQYYGYCGGCQWQHIKYSTQLKYKKELVEEVIRRIGKIDEARILDTIPSPEQFGYRNKMEFTFSNKPWFLPFQEEKKEFSLGLHIPGSYDRVIDIEECFLQPDEGNIILDIVRKYVEKTKIPVYDMKTHEGFWRFLTLRNSKYSGEWMVNFVTSDEAIQVLGPLAEEICRRVKNVRTVVNNISKKKAAVAVGDREVVIKGEGYIEDKIGEYRFQISANSFFQTNPKAVEKLYEKVKEYAELSGSEEVLDLYSGIGTISIFLSKDARRIVGIEIVESAVKDAKRNCRINGIDNCQFIVGDIREVLPRLSVKPDVIIIDPPRPGMHKDVVKKVLELDAKRIVYVSCNPATLARDLSYLKEKYIIEEIQPVDMFPHTHHIEAVAKCIKK